MAKTRTRWSTGPELRKPTEVFRRAIFLFVLGACLPPRPAVGQPAWTTMAPRPEGCPAHAFRTVWTGPPLNRLLVWGGIAASGEYTNSGCSWDPASDRWSPLSGVDAPEPRAGHSATWTGTEMIVWGGIDGNGYFFRGGGRYDPSTDTWKPVSRVDGPGARQGHTAVWTGSRMIIWGGVVAPGFPRTGALYDPVSNSWTPMTNVGEPDSRSGHTDVWTGSRLIVWGGVGPSNVVRNDGGIYDPVSDTWSPMGGTPPAARHGHSSVWTGSRLVVWGGRASMPGTELGTGGVYDPASDSWIPTASLGAPSSRGDQATEWTGSRMIVWGGISGSDATGRSCIGDGALFDPVSNSWTPLEGPGAPSARAGAQTAWTGTELLVFAGSDCEFSVLANGGRWRAVSLGQLWFHPLPPCRVLDTRRSTGAPGEGSALGAEERRPIDVVSSGCGVPAAAASIVGNVTVTDAEQAGFLGIGAGNSPGGLLGTLAFQAGRPRAVLVFPRLATDGTGTVALENHSSGAAHAILDVTGYWR